MAIINGTSGNDFEFGTAAGDTISLYGGKDWGHGSAGTDFITGAAGDDQFFGGDADDRLDGGSEVDSLRRCRQ
jgi:serralysin